MPRIACLTNLPHTPSSRFRIRQYISLLKDEHDLELTDFPRRYSTEMAGRPNKRIRSSPTLLGLAVCYEVANLANRYKALKSARHFDATVISRQLMIGYPSLEYLLTKPLILDVDDAVFLSGKLSRISFDLLLKKADLVLAGNRYLSDYSQRINGNVVTVPTSVDTDRWKPDASKQISDRFIVGWSGTSTSFFFWSRFRSHSSDLLKSQTQNSG